MVKSGEEILLKSPLSLLLLVDDSLEFAGLSSQTFLSHPELIHDQDKILVHPVELLLFGSHLVRHFIQLLDLGLLWTDVLSEFLDLVIQNELELLKLLNLLLLFLDALLFLLQGLVTFP